MGKYCWVSKAFDQLLRCQLKTWFIDGILCQSQDQLQWKLNRGFSSWWFQKLSAGINQFKQITLIIVLNFSRYISENPFCCCLKQVLSDVTTIPHLDIHCISTFIAGKSLLWGLCFLCSQMSSYLLKYGSNCYAF